jgi:nuclear migration protein JNM1
MESLLSLLTQPNQLEAVSRRVKLLLADLDKTTASSKTAALKDDPLDNADGRENGQVKVNAKELERIDKLYTALPRLEPLLPLLPPLLTRLRSLSALHAGASTFQSTLAKVEGESATMRDTDEEMKEILSRLEAGMKGQADVMKNNWTGLADRLTQLESRLASL